MKNNIPIYKFFLSLMIVNLFLVSIAIFFYSDNFLLWNYPFSYSGDTFNMQGLPNNISSRIYSLDIILSSVIMLALAFNLYKVRTVQKNIYKTMICFMTGLGFLIASLNPDDIRHNFHVLGSALVVASLWIFATTNLFEIKKEISPAKYYFLQTILQIPIFAYAIAFFLNMDPINFILQKFALLGLGIALLYSTQFSQKTPGNC